MDLHAQKCQEQWSTWTNHCDTPLRALLRDLARHTSCHETFPKSACSPRDKRVDPTDETSPRTRTICLIFSTTKHQHHTFKKKKKKNIQDVGYSICSFRSLYGRYLHQHSPRALCPRVDGLSRWIHLLVGESAHKRLGSSLGHLSPSRTNQSSSRIAL